MYVFSFQNFSVIWLLDFVELEFGFESSDGSCPATFYLENAGNKIIIWLHSIGLLQIEERCANLILDDDQLHEVCKRLLDEINHGLAKETNAQATIKCFPTYVRELPNGEGKNSAAPTPTSRRLTVDWLQLVLGLLLLYRIVRISSTRQQCKAGDYS